MALLAVMLGWGVLAPASIAGAVGGVVLLIGGALIGIPHGSSDFLVAHWLLDPRLRRWWLPVFLAAYLSVTATVLLGWHFSPVATLLAFLIVSGLHFGAGENGSRSDDTVARYVARAATPIVPIFLFSPAEVAGIVGLMVGKSASTIVSLIDQARPVGLALYIAVLGWVAVRALMASWRPGTSYVGREATELVLLALAAAALPPLLTFAVYFCLLHAVRHMARLGRDAFPTDGTAALRLAAAVVLPSALMCGVALGLCWTRIAGVLTTEHTLAIALQLTASLTVPHLMLEWWAERYAS